MSDEEFLDWADYEYDHGRIVESAETLRQRIAYDMAPDDMLDASPEKLGLHPASEEVREMEADASIHRRIRVAPLSPMLHILAGLSSEVMNKAILVGRQQSGWASDTAEEVSAQQIYSATFAILATLVDLGVVHLPHLDIVGESE